MSKVALVVERSSDLATVAAAVRSITGQGMADISRNVRSGRPVAEYTLFQNDHEEVADQLRRLGREFSRAGVPVRAYELDESESYDHLADPSQAEIPLTTLANILDAHDREIERQQELSANGL